MKTLAPKAEAASRSISRISYVRDLLRELIIRDLKIRYKRSYLGIAWSLLNPLSQILIFSFLFTTVLPLQIPHYTAFIFAGLLAWSWFSSALISAPGAIAGNPELVRRPGFPVAVLPVLTVASNGIHYLLALPILLIFTAADGGTLGITLLALPLIMSIQSCFTLGLVFLIAASHVRFRDTQHLVGMVMMLAFYITPVFYHADSIPEEYRILYDANPMAALLTAYREVLIENRWPDAAALLFVCAISGACLAIGYAVFDRVSARFADEL